MKYTLTENTMTLRDGTVLHQIRAEEDFDDVCKGDLGGWIEKESNLSQKGDCWVCKSAIVYGDAEVSGNALIYGNACVSENSRISDYVEIYGDAQVAGNAWVFGDAEVSSNARVYGDAKICGEARIECYEDWATLTLDGSTITLFRNAKEFGGFEVKIIDGDGRLNEFFDVVAVMKKIFVEKMEAAHNEES